MIIRKIRRDELKRCAQLSALAFEFPMHGAKQTPEAFVREKTENPRSLEDVHWDSRWAAFEDDDATMMATFCVLPWRANFDGHEVVMGGIGGVASLPQYRRGGAIRCCFEAALPDMYAQGMTLSYLYAFSNAFYRKFGYELACDGTRWRLRLEGLPAVGYAVAIRETETLHSLHDVSSGRSELGVVAMTDKQLQLINKALYIHDLAFAELARLQTYVFMRKRHPLAERQSLALEDLRPYPFVTYDQTQAPGYYSEESLFFAPMVKNIHVSDRATKMSVIRSTDAFSVGVDLPNFNQDIYFKRRAAEMVAIPFSDQADPIAVGVLMKNGHAPSDIAQRYIALLNEHVERLRVPKGDG